MLLHISALHVSMSYNKEDSMFDRTVCVLHCFLDLKQKKINFPRGTNLIATKKTKFSEFPNRV